MLAQNIMKLLQKYGVNFLNGLGTTLLLALISVSIGCVIGALVAILRLGKSKVLRAVAAVYTEVIRDTPLPGEAALVGQGVSYCATCDGMLYRGKTAVVTGNAADLREEANFLQGIGVRVTVITRQELDGLAPGIGHRTARSMAIQGDGRLEGFVADGEQIPCDVVFVLREVMAPDALVPGLELDGRFVKVNRRQETNIPGLYAAGDCTGKPLQIAKAVGEGLIAAQEAAKG